MTDEERDRILSVPFTFDPKRVTATPTSEPEGHGAWCSTCGSKYPNPHKGWCRASPTEPQEVPLADQMQDASEQRKRDWEKKYPAEPQEAAPLEPFCKNCGGLKSAHIKENRTYGIGLRCVAGRDCWFVPRIDPTAPPPSERRNRQPCTVSGRHIYASGKCQFCDSPEASPPSEQERQAYASVCEKCGALAVLVGRCWRCNPAGPPSEQAPATTSELPGTPKSVVGLPTSEPLTEALQKYADALWEVHATREEDDDEQEAARSEILALFSSQQARIEELEKPALCGVCGGSGKPISGLPCVCGGAGTEMAELQGFQEHCYNLEAELALLRRNQITPEEARHTMRGLELAKYGSLKLFAKLSRIATRDQDSKAASPEQTT